MAGNNGCRIYDSCIVVLVADDLGADSNAKIPVGSYFLKLKQEVGLWGK